MYNVCCRDYMYKQYAVLTYYNTLVYDHISFSDLRHPQSRIAVQNTSRAITCNQ